VGRLRVANCSSLRLSGRRIRGDLVVSLLGREDHKKVGAKGEAKAREDVTRQSLNSSDPLYTLSEPHLPPSYSCFRPHFA
jgi:hypothetical protein